MRLFQAQPIGIPYAGFRYCCLSNSCFKPNRLGFLMQEFHQSPLYTVVSSPTDWDSLCRKKRTDIDNVVNVSSPTDWDSLCRIEYCQNIEAFIVSSPTDWDSLCRKKENSGKVIPVSSPTDWDSLCRLSLFREITIKMFQAQPIGIPYAGLLKIDLSNELKFQAQPIGIPYARFFKVE